MTTPVALELPAWAEKMVDAVAVERAAEEQEEVAKMLGGRQTKLGFTTNALQVVSKRYLLHNHAGEVLETPEQMFYRVAKGLAEVELRYGETQETVDQLTRDFFSMMVNFEFTPAGRTLTNVGAPTPLVANCIVLHIEDSMESIFSTLRDAALLQKAGSGLGFPLHLMRPAGSVTKASFGNASGPVSFLHVYNSAFGVIKQQNRHGANMAVMRVDHPDILEFLHCKDKEGDIKNFNVSVGLTDKFMAAVESNDPNPWLCHFGDQVSKPRRITRDQNFSITNIEEVDMTARQIFDEIVDSAWKMGEPGCVFLDAVNEVNPVPGLGRIEACNPCGEQFLHDGDVCNLGSINLEKFVTPDGKIDEAKLQRIAALGTRFLDNVVDLSDFPVERVNKARLANRRVGLGIMGFADMLYQMKVGYDSQVGRDTAEKVMAIIRDAGAKASEELGESKGVFPNWDLSVFKDKVKRRNAAITNIAPTGTISMMFNVSGGVEPYFALAYYYKGILGGNVQLSYVNKHLKKALVDEGIFSDELMDKIIKKGSLQRVDEVPQHIKDVFVTSMDISAEDHILMQGAMQKNCENAISKTINFKNSATRDDVLRGYLLAWKQRCKGCTVYRDGSRFLQVLNLNDDEEDAEKETEETPMDTTETTKDPVDAVMDEAASKLKRKAAEANLPVVGDVVKQKRRIAIIPQCPDCKKSLTPMEGCHSCMECGFSLCSK